MKVTLEQAEEAHRAWLAAFPEMVEHLACQPDYNNPGKFRTVTWTGFERCNCIENEIRNTEFQSTSGDGASDMLWECYRAGYRLVNFIHDEVISEIAITTVEDIMDKIRKLDRIMVDSMSRTLSHVNIKTEASLMTRWFKEAEEKVDETGCLMVMTGFDENGKPHYEPLVAIVEKEQERRTA